MFEGAIRRVVGREPRPRPSNKEVLYSDSAVPALGETIGVIAGNGPFPLRFVEEAKERGHRIVAVCHRDETDPIIESKVEQAVWIRVGELGKMIRAFQDAAVLHVAMAGGISRVKHFRDVKLDARGAALMMKLRSMKDDVIMRGIAGELLKEGIEVIPCTIFLQNCLAREGTLTKTRPSKDEFADIEVGISALRAMSNQDIGQLVVVRGGVVVAVEAAEGTNDCIIRGGKLGGEGVVVVKCAKPTQDMRFDVPTIGLQTIDTLIESHVRVLAIEATRTLIIDEEQVVEKANRHKIAIYGVAPLV